MYSAAKSGVLHFTRSLSYMAKTDKIHINAICPFFSKTAMGVGAEAILDIKDWVPIEKVTDAVACH